ncbi:RHS repeat-associated core domain-containing protein [Chitinophaga pollutisoli]|uniref:RHS repeat-associated core domain-containing protein n=1 Tax=Chitinophaga pollutisoli TaxID=3133966 RepID=A0ABZ2YPX8_9BACT
MRYRKKVVRACRYGFNGKENDNEVKGIEGSQQDYGFRIYDPRVAKFLSVDPLTKSYPHYTPYQFAGNTPIMAIDLDGAEELPYVQKFDPHTDAFPYIAALNNGAINAVNSVIGIWNSGVEVTRSVGRGTFREDIAAEFGGYADQIKRDYYYHTTTPISQQAKDVGNYVLSPQFVEDIATAYIGGKIVPGSSKSGSKLPVLSVSTAESAPAMNLQQRAQAIHNALPEATQRRTTTAVGEAVDGAGNTKYLVGSSEERLRPAQRGVLRSNEIAVKGKGHAETTILDYASQNNLKVNSIAASRPICAGCEAALRSQNVAPASPLKSAATPMKKWDASSYIPGSSPSSGP